MEPREESEDFHNKYAKRLNTPWIPEITSDHNEWRTMRQGYSDLQYHIDNHHAKNVTTDPTGNVWTTSRPDTNGMSPTEFHEHLHKIEHFKFGNEHKHFKPKKRQMREEYDKWKCGYCGKYYVVQDLARDCEHKHESE